MTILNDITQIGSPIISTTCELIDVTRHFRLSQAELTPVGYVLAFLVICGSSLLVAYLIGYKVVKK